MRKSILSFLAAAAAASCALTLSALAQTSETAPASAAPAFTAPSSRCSSAPAEEPAVPDGATVSDRNIVRANEAYTVWAAAVQQVSECRRVEHGELVAAHNAIAASHSALNGRLREVSQNWMTQRTAYCSRPRRQCRSITNADVEVAPAPFTGACADAPTSPEPVTPDGAQANQAQMDAADEAYLAWGREAKQILECKKTLYDRSAEVIRARLAEHDAIAQRYAAVTALWDAERTEYCARPRKQCEVPAEQ